MSEKHLMEEIEHWKNLSRESTLKIVLLQEAVDLMKEQRTELYREKKELEKVKSLN